MLESDVQAGDQHSLDFAQRRGFVITQRLSYSTLSLEALDEQALAAAQDQLAAQGITLSTVVLPPLTSEIERAIVPVLQTASADIPGRNRPTTAEEVVWDILSSSEGNETLIAAAYHNGECIGASVIRRETEANAFQSLTGVLREWRGRGVASALKRALMQVAYERGVRHIRTFNHTDNAPILAINRRLGYQPEPGKLVLRAKLPSSA